MIEKLFDRMDSWRHLPNYQLERRADLFFTLYLKEVLKNNLGFDFKEIIIPEFPVRIGTIFPKVPINKSYKIDYLCISKDETKSVLVELKTEIKSRRFEQDKYLKKSTECGLNKLLEGLVEIFQATNSKRKYFYLLTKLEELGLLRLPPEMNDFIESENLIGISEVSKKIEITSRVSETEVRYIQPYGDSDLVIPFSEFANVVRQKNDPFSKRFAVSLDEWAQIQAGRWFEK